MNRVPKIFAVSMALIGLNAALRATPVDLKNPGMEGAYRDLGASGKVTGQIAEGWSDNSSWADVAVNYAADTTNAHSGTTSQRIAASAVRSGAVQFVQATQVLKDHAYAISVWLRGTGTINIALRQTGAPSTYYATTSVTLTPEWKEYRVISQHPKEDTDALVMLRAEGPATFWADDVVLDDTTAGTGATSGSSTTVEINNPDMEGTYQSVSMSTKISGNIADGWSDNSDWADVSVHYDSDSTNPHSGQESQRIGINTFNSGAVQFKQNVQLQKGHTYAVTAWMRGNEGAKASVALRKPGAPYTEYAANTVSLTPDWKEYRADGKPVDEDTEALLMIRADSPITFWVDDVQVQDTTAAP